MKVRLGRATVLGVVMLAGARTPLGGQVSAQSSPAVVFVHGRGQGGKTIKEVRDRFVRTFLARERALFGAEVIPEADIAFVWYADVIDPDVQHAPKSPGCRYLGSASAETAAASDDLRQRLIRFATDLGLDEQALRTFTTDTHKYLSDVAVRCEADARVETELAARGFSTRSLVVVAHSMGGIVAFSALEKNAQVVGAQGRLHVAHFITIGTQVGVELILRALEGSYTQLPVPVPNTIARWTNFANKDDKLAFSTHASFKAADARRVPQDVSVDRPGDRHAITTYLADDVVVRTIVGAWCDASVVRPAGCPQ